MTWAKFKSISIFRTCFDKNVITQYKTKQSITITRSLRRQHCSSQFVSLGPFAAVRKTSLHSSSIWQYQRGSSWSSLFLCTSVVPCQWAPVYGWSRGLETSPPTSSLSLSVRRTRLSTVSDQTFPDADARTWTVCPNMSCLHPLHVCLFFEVASRLSSSSTPSHDFHRYKCLRSDCVVIIGHFNRSLYLLIYLHTYAIINCLGYAFAAESQTRHYLQPIKRVRDLDDSTVEMCGNRFSYQIPPISMTSFPFPSET